MIVPMVLAMLAMASDSVQPAAPVEATEGDDLVVLGRRLSNWRATFPTRDGQVTCRMRQSSGDTELDARACDVGIACLEQTRATFTRAARRALPREQRGQFRADANAAFSRCMTERLRVAMEELAATRASAAGA